MFKYNATYPASEGEHPLWQHPPRHEYHAGETASRSQRHEDQKCNFAFHEYSLLIELQDACKYWIFNNYYVPPGIVTYGRWKDHSPWQIYSNSYHLGSKHGSLAPPFPQKAGLMPFLAWLAVFLIVLIYEEEEYVQHFHFHQFSFASSLWRQSLPYYHSASHRIWTLLESSAVSLCVCKVRISHRGDVSCLWSAVYNNCVWEGRGWYSPFSGLFVVFVSLGYNFVWVGVLCTSEYCEGARDQS